MFTGIIEEIAQIVRIENQDNNIHFFIKSNITHQLKIDQSVAHNGICLTIVGIENDIYQVTAINETLKKTNASEWKVGQWVNIERAMKLGDRLDGHIVQGHIDQIGVCQKIENQNGSTLFSFSYDTSLGNITIEKGSVTINGVSLTVVNSQKGKFSVAIIPYTFEHTTFKHLQEGHLVNLEFDVIGKYIQARMNFMAS